ncbi:TetR family transcriptional regulator [Streptomyces sp. Ag109_O5-1]|uniref:TetR/AcrR family transcriptional regulator n=1 Tax=Streptomyces sp. Ag109_O5-1 TaxID=1938851 RepID=UPI000F4F72AF|nr:TetR/AcrR family transcriptional regulator [Streptomyces sp. Ag109_O5-1]RPE39217.1 TetR family transcriptional regulator [Streptomyces sp. Ag109_O5-1]
MPVQHSRKPGRPPASTDEPQPPAAGSGLRADARHNRNRILEAAREAFTTQGIDVPLTTIARRAGVGAATLYRHFPTRVSLITEAFTEQFADCAAVLDKALGDPDPWHGFCSFIEKVCAMQATDRGFTAAFLSQFPDAIDYERERTRVENDLAQLVQRAKAVGRLRDDFDHADITLLLLANSGVVGESQQVSLAASRRLVTYLLHSFRADQTEPLPPPAPLGLHHIHQSPPRH